MNRPDLTARSRPYSPAEALGAVWRTVRRPENRPPMPARIDFPRIIGPAAEQIDSHFPVAMLALATGRLAGVAQWARALSGTRVTVLTDVAQTTITVIGATARGPVIGVHDTVADWPLDEQLGERIVTVEDLSALAEIAAASTLAGVR